MKNTQFLKPICRINVHAKHITLHSQIHTRIFIYRQRSPSNALSKTSSISFESPKKSSTREKWSIDLNVKRCSFCSPARLRIFRNTIRRQRFIVADFAVNASTMGIDKRENKLIDFRRKTVRFRAENEMGQRGRSSLFCLPTLPPSGPNSTLFR